MIDFLKNNVSMTLQIVLNLERLLKDFPTEFFFFFGNTGQGLTLARQTLYHLSHSTTLFGVKYFSR
jgi:hypothetical protein